MSSTPVAPVTNLPVTESLKVVESAWFQLGFLGLLLVVGVLIIRYLLKQIKTTEDRYNAQREAHTEERKLNEANHRAEWEKLKSSHEEDRQKWADATEKHMTMIVTTMKENSDNFTRIVEGTLKENNRFLSTASEVMRECRKAS